MPLPLIGLGSMLSNPMFQKAAISIAPSVISGIGNLLKGPESPDPFRQAQMNLLRSLQRPNQFQRVDFAPQEDRARKQYEEVAEPGLMERFTGMGGQRSSQFGRQLGYGRADLESQLAAARGQHQLGQQQAQMQHQGLEQGRIGQLMGLLGGERQSGFKQQQLDQQMKMAQIQEALKRQQMGQEYSLGRGRLGLGLQDLGLRRQLGLGQLSNQFGGQEGRFGEHPSFQTFTTEGGGFFESPGVQKGIGQLGKMLGGAMYNYFNPIQKSNSKSIG